MYRFVIFREICSTVKTSTTTTTTTTAAAAAVAMTTSTTTVMVTFFGTEIQTIFFTNVSNSTSKKRATSDNIFSLFLFLFISNLFSYFDRFVFSCIKCFIHEKVQIEMFQVPRTGEGGGNMKNGNNRNLSNTQCGRCYTRVVLIDSSIIQTKRAKERNRNQK